MINIWLVLDSQGRRQDWFAGQLNISPSYVSLLRAGKRSWTSELRTKASRVVQLPEAALAFEPLDEIRVVNAYRQS